MFQGNQSDPVTILRFLRWIGAQTDGTAYAGEVTRKDLSLSLIPPAPSSLSALWPGGGHQVVRNAHTHIGFRISANQERRVG